MQRTITNKEKFKDYIRTQLGEEYNCLELSDKQLDNIVDIVVDYYTEFGYDGLDQKAYILPIQKDVQDYVIGDDNDEPEIYSIFDLIEESRLNTLMLNYNFGDSTMALSWVGTNSMWYRFLDFEIFGSYLEMYNKIYKKKTSYKWNEMNQTFHLFSPPKENTTLALMVYQYHDSQIGFYNKRWVKAYAVEQARLQWGRNLMKVSGVPLPGGAQLNDSEIRSDAKAEIEQLEEFFQNTYVEPSGMWIG